MNGVILVGLMKRRREGSGKGRGVLTHLGRKEGVILVGLIGF
jgi:hypothetical protein